MLSAFNFETLKDEIQKVVFAWQYHKSIFAVLYKPVVVFKKFSFVRLLDANETYMCNSTKKNSKVSRLWKAIPQMQTIHSGVESNMKFALCEVFYLFQKSLCM